MPAFYALDATLDLHAAAGHVPAWWVQRQHGGPVTTVLPIPLEGMIPALEDCRLKGTFLWSPSACGTRHSFGATSLRDLVCYGQQGRDVIARVTVASFQRTFLLTLLRRESAVCRPTRLPFHTTSLST